MARRLRFNGTNSGNDGCPAVHEDIGTGEIIVQGPQLIDPADVAQLQHLSDGEVAIVVPRDLLVDWGPKDVTRQAKTIDLDAFAKLFTTFRHTAWRLEARGRYASDELTTTYAQFTRNEPVDWDDVDAQWCANRRTQAALGKRIERVRIVDQPPTIGQLYLLDNARRNSAVGETIMNLWRRDAEELNLPAEDFWIFDSRLVARLNFDEADNLVNVELITEPAEVVRYCMARDAAMHHAIPYEKFAVALTTKEQ
ncbi:hypothetical protein GCM10009733_007900 [Nonomuraea maheshkhaliensis]|uniref:DUF6879 domain-containing protein n=1 Tax=Nonomuraea maheshkhaliensis TaxID=419590 RepID=A0ABN2ERC9_9ACTN